MGAGGFTLRFLSSGASQCLHPRAERPGSSAVGTWAARGSPQPPNSGNRREASKDSRWEGSEENLSTTQLLREAGVGPDLRGRSGTRRRPGVPGNAKGALGEGWRRPEARSPGSGLSVGVSGWAGWGNAVSDPATLERHPFTESGLAALKSLSGSPSRVPAERRAGPPSPGRAGLSLSAIAAAHWTTSVGRPQPLICELRSARGSSSQIRAGLALGVPQPRAWSSGSAGRRGGAAPAARPSPPRGRWVSQASKLRVWRYRLSPRWKVRGLEFFLARARTPGTSMLGGGDQTLDWAGVPPGQKAGGQLGGIHPQGPARSPRASVQTLPGPRAGLAPEPQRPPSLSGRSGAPGRSLESP